MVGNQETPNLLCDQIDTRDLLEALVDNTQSRAPKVLAPSVGEEFLQRSFSLLLALVGDDCTRNIFYENSFTNTVICAKNFGISGRGIVQCRDDSDCFCIAAMLY